MSSPVIQVSHLGKKYRIRHQQQGGMRYKALRDILADRTKGVARRLWSAFRPSLSSGFRPLSSDSRPLSSGSEDFWALKDVSFEVNQGDVLGIIGRNGAGKSTLLKILSRITEPTEGCVKIRGRVASLLEVGTGFHPELTGRENIFLNGAILGMTRAEIKSKFAEIVAFAEVDKFLDTPVKRYSSGMYVRLAFAVAAHLDPEVLVVDEVLAVGDAEFQKKCLGKMEQVAKGGRTVLFVSHNMSSIERLCSSAMVLGGGVVVSNSMSPRQAISLYLAKSTGQQVTFRGGPVRHASVTCSQHDILIAVEYEAPYALSFPCLGFIISDHVGNPICGANPKIVPPLAPLPRSAQGRIEARITSPRLLSGTYRLSLWLGDGTTDFFGERDCLVFDVLNAQHSSNAAINGPVVVDCDWRGTASCMPPVPNDQ